MPGAALHSEALLSRRFPDRRAGDERRKVCAPVDVDLTEERRVEERRFHTMDDKLAANARQRNTEGRFTGAAPSGYVPFGEN